MRWPRQTPKLGSKRTVSKFLWIPREIDGETRWLERARIDQEFKRQSKPVKVDGHEILVDYIDWFNVAWNDELEPLHETEPFPGPSVPNEILPPKQPNGCMWVVAVNDFPHCIVHGDEKRAEKIRAELQRKADARRQPGWSQTFYHKHLLPVK